MRKISLLALLAPVAALAEGETATIDFSSAGAAASDIAQAYSGYVTTYMVPAAITITIAGIILWLIQRIPRQAGAGKK